jgi:hypothetical protein
MTAIRISLSFTKLRDDDIDSKSLAIINSLVGNPNFPNPVPTLVEVTASRNAYVEAMSANIKGGKNETSIKNQARKDLEENLRLLGLYVQANCKDNEVIAQSSGYDIQKTKRPIGILAKPTNFKVDSGPVPGSLIVSSDKIDGAKGYIFEITNTPLTNDSVWKPIFSSTKNCLFDGLLSGSQYALRMAGLGSEPIKVYSDVILRYVL